MSCGVGRRCGSDPEFLRLWCRPAATALIQPLVWESPYAAGVALKTKRKKEEARDTGTGYRTNVNGQSVLSSVTTQELTAGPTFSQKLTQPETEQKKQLSTGVDLSSGRAHCTPPAAQPPRKQKPSRSPAGV